LRLQVANSELDLTTEEYQELNSADIKKYVELFLNNPKDRLTLQKLLQDCKIDREEFINKVTAKSENNFMYLRYVLPGIAEGFYNDLGLNGLPDGLKSYYQQHWVRMRMEEKNHKIEVIILYIIIEWNTPPISLNDIAAISSNDEYEVEEILSKWREYLKEQVVNEDGEEKKCYRVYHASFLDFLKGQRKLDKSRKIFEEVNQRIASYLYD
jgi:hypothetical protein